MVLYCRDITEPDPKVIQPAKYDPKYLLAYREELRYGQSLLMFRYNGKFVRNLKLNYVGRESEVVLAALKKLTFKS